MEQRLLELFQRELLTQCELVLLGGSLLNQTLQSPPPRGVNPTAPSWFALQGILVSAANISKFLWGSRGKLAEERKPLRDSIGADDDSPLNSTDLRNDFEHFDERIVRWLGGDHPHNYVGRNIASAGGIVIHGEEAATRFGNFDPETGIVEFWENSASVPAILQEVQGIEERLREALSP